MAGSVGVSTPPYYQQPAASSWVIPPSQNDDKLRMATTAQPLISDARGFDRRRSLRKPHVAEAWICSPTATRPEEKVEVTAINLSRHGVAFEIPKNLPTDTFYVMEVGVGDQRLVSEVRIISCRKAENGNYEVGAEFC